MKKIILSVLVVVVSVAVGAVGGWFVYDRVNNDRERPAADEANSGSDVYVYNEDETLSEKIDNEANEPERLIIGEWKNDIGVGSYIFNEDGTMSGKIDAVLGDVSIRGTYTINKENSTITISYTALGVSYNDARTFVIDGDKLTLTDPTTGDSNFTRVLSSAQTSSAA